MYGATFLYFIYWKNIICMEQFIKEFKGSKQLVVIEN
jgi:hypothetical protein